MLLSDIISAKQINLFKKKQKIKYITSNSKLVKNNSIFVTDFKKEIKEKYIKEAIKKGVVLILTNKRIKNIQTPQLIKTNLDKKVDEILNKLAPNPPKKVIAITGTNGKTSVVWLISNILKLLKQNIKSLGTLGYFDNLKKLNDSFLTTPEKEEIHQFSFTKLKNNKIFIFEASSHGISKNRIKNLPINIAAITNVTQDHLDYHKTFKQYKNTKFQLFLKYLNKDGTAILNDNIEGINLLKEKLKKKKIKFITYGKNKSNVNCSINNKKTIIKINSKIYLTNYKTTYNFELENLSCAISCLLPVGFEIKEIIKFLEKIKTPKGRVQLVKKIENGAKIFVDYAHTPDALKNILCNEKNNIKPSIVFGCGGNRDKSKRSEMGKIANKYANKVYITDDNPRNENPKLIRNQIHKHCSRAYNIGNRSEAIEFAIKDIDPKDILIIAGKGHENKQIVKKKNIFFDDYIIAKNILKKINNNLEYKVINYLISNHKKIKINSQNIKKGDIFCALKGSSVHGNKYIKDAIKNGAKFVITDKKIKNYNKKILDVKNIFNFLEYIAVKKRNLFKGNVIAITGSVGKTSVKEYLNHFLAKQGIVSSSIKSYNNYLGVLISMINMNIKSKYSIFEIGTNNFGEIKKLTSLVLPEQVIITNINPTHLDNFQNTRNIAIEKSDIFNPKFNKNINLVILPNSNQDEFFLKKIARKCKIKNILTYGNNIKSNYYVKKIEKINNNSLKLYYNCPKKNFSFKTSNLFDHQILNLTIPLIIFDFNNLSMKNFSYKINKIPIAEGRGSHHLVYLNNQKIKLINESYNASPTSMLNSISYFDDYKISFLNRKIIIIGEMLELGKKTLFFHKNIAINVLKKEFDIIIFCGEIYKDILSNIRLLGKNVFYLKNEKKIIQFLQNNIQKNDIILAKGSNASYVNKMVNIILEKR